MILALKQTLLRFLVFPPLLLLSILCGSAKADFESGDLYFLLPCEPIGQQTSTTLGQVTHLSWSPFVLPQGKQIRQENALQAINLEQLRAAGGWQRWFHQAQEDARKKLQKLSPIVERSEHGSVEMVRYETPHAASLLIAHDALFELWKEQLGAEILVLIDEKERLWLISALSPQRGNQLKQWQISSELSREFLLLGEHGLMPGGSLKNQ